MIKIYTCAHKRPDFLALQLKSFKKNLSDEFEFIVFNNASFDPNKQHYLSINKWCDDNNIQHIDITNDEDLTNAIANNHQEKVFDNNGEYANSVIACAYPICWAWKQIISKTDDLICIIDSDMFFIDKENISQMLNKYDIVHMPQSRGENSEVRYMWNGILYMNLNKMPDKSSLNWWCGYVEGQPVDVGGQTHYYLKQYKKQLKLLEFKLHYVQDDPSCNFHPSNYEYFASNEEKILLHYRGGSNWDNKTPDYHTRKTTWLKHKLA
jgi:hypothetical protein